jgi:uncharacterized paraquat-inducible protein A
MPDQHNPAYHDLAIATMYRLDPEKLAAIRRAISGLTRCPRCDAVNRADQPRCDRCGAKLYPEVPDTDEEKALRNGQGKRRDDK